MHDQGRKNFVGMIILEKFSGAKEHLVELNSMKRKMLETKAGVRHRHGEFITDMKTGTTK